MVYLLWIVFSILKFQFAMIASTLIINSIILTIESLISGILGILLFLYLGQKVEKYIVKKFPSRFKKFSWKNRILVHIRRIGGITGISILTPILLGIPLGVLLSLTLTSDKNRILKPMIISITFWCFLLFIIGYLG